MKVLIVLITLSLTACGSLKDQGIKGTIFWVSGNRMPGTGSENQSNSKPVVREIYIFPALNARDHKAVDGFFQNIGVAPAVVLKSGSDGAFLAKLPPGKYSVLSKEENGLFANRFDGDGCIHCFEVRAHEFVNIDFSIDYEAAY